MIFIFTLGLLISGITNLSSEELKVVATTEWTAAFCRAAGLEDIRVLAPSSLQHPSDYDLKPSDIPALMEADLIVFGGYEAMMGRIRSNAAGTDTRMLQIITTYTLPVMEKSIRDIAAVAESEGKAEENILIIREAFAEARRLASQAGLAGYSALVHKFQVPFARGAGLNVVKEFGPAAPGPRLIAEAAETDAALVIDNRHNPVSAAIREVLPDSFALELINFPGIGGTRTLADVILYNARMLTGTAD